MLTDDYAFEVVPDGGIAKNATVYADYFGGAIHPVEAVWYTKNDLQQPILVSITSVAFSEQVRFATVTYGESLSRIKTDTGHMLECTPGYPVWIARADYVQAQDVRVGDFVAIIDHSRPSGINVATVRSVERFGHWGPVYDFRTDNDESNFFASGVLVGQPLV